MQIFRNGASRAKLVACQGLKLLFLLAQQGQETLSFSAALRAHCALKPFTRTVAQRLHVYFCMPDQGLNGENLESALLPLHVRPASIITDKAILT